MANFTPKFTKITPAKPPKKKASNPSASWPTLPPSDTGFVPVTPVGGPPTLTQILANDPAFQAQLANLQASSVADRAGLTSARQRALIGFGSIPQFPNYSGVGDINSDITPQIRALADAATQAGLSTTARISRADQIAQHNIVDQLAARGMFHSGATGSQLGAEQLAMTQQNYDAMAKLTDYLAGAQAGFVAAENARKQQELALQQQAAANAAANPPVGYGFGPGFNTVPGTPTPPPVLNPGAMFGGGFQGVTAPKAPVKAKPKPKPKPVKINPYAGLH